MKKSAVISECGKFRYELHRTWDYSLPKVLFVMLNPSTADAEVDDPTIRRCINFAKEWGFGGLLVGNIFAIRSSNPKNITPPTTWTDNSTYLNSLYRQAHTIVCAWGNSPVPIKVYPVWMKNNQRLFCLGINKSGSPKHPLYIASNTKLQKYFHS